jgi:hypothetical protein
MTYHQILSLTMFALVMSADRLSLQTRRSEIIQALKKLPDQVRPKHLRNPSFDANVV